MPYAQINGIDLYYEVHGAGPPILFAHGQGGNHLSWWQQVPFFARHYTCITFDHRAFGRSLDSNCLGRTSFGADALALVEYLQLDDLRLVAHSMGARSVVPVALRASQRCRALVLCGSTGAIFDEDIHELQEQARQARGERGLGAFSVAPSFREQHPDRYFLLRQISRLNPPRDETFRRPRPPGAQTPRASVQERLAATGLPVLFVAGEHDAITPPSLIQASQRVLPGSRLHVACGSGHSVYFEKPDEFNQVVMRFLQEADASPAREPASPPDTIGP